MPDNCWGLGVWASRPHLSVWQIFRKCFLYYLVPEVRAGRPHPQSTALNTQLCKKGGEVQYLNLKFVALLRRTFLVET